MFRPLATALIAALLATAPALPAAAAPAQPEAQAAPPMVSLPQALRVSASDQTGPVTLRRQVAILGDEVRLGDLFTGPVPTPERVVARAPDVGETLELDARWLAAMAQSSGVDWRPLSNADSVTVSRQGRYVGNEEILAALTSTLERQGMSPAAELELAGTLRPVLVDAASAAMVEVIDAAYDPRSGRFSAIVGLPGEASAKPLRLSGRAFETVEVPVLVRGIQRNSVVGPEDIDWVKVRAHTLAGGIATDPADLVGMAAQRTLRPGEPLRLRDLAEPSLVEKGEMVTMILKTPLMTLTAKGRAMEDAPLGATVRLQNLRSNKTITGVVTAARTVEVDTSQSLALR